jgi:hypothetical protein
VEAVDEFKTEGNQQRNEQQQVGQECRRSGAARSDVGIKTVRDEQHAPRQQEEKYQRGARIEPAFEIGARSAYAGFRRADRGIGHVGYL